MRIEKLLCNGLFVLAISSLTACQNKDTQTAAIDASWQMIVVEQGAGKVSVLDPITGIKKGEVKVGYNPHEIALSADGQTAYVTNFGIEDYDHTIGTPGTNISVIDIPTMEVKASFATNRSSAQESNKAPHGIKLRPGRPYELYVNVEVGDSMLVYDVRSGLIQRSFPLPPGTHNFLFSSCGDTLFLFSAEQGIFSLDPDTGAQWQHFETGSPSRGLTYTIDQQYLIVSCHNEIYLLHPADLRMYRHFQDLGVQQIIYSTPTPDGQYILAPCPYDERVLVVDIKTGAVRKRIVTGKAPIYVQIAPSEKEAIVANAMDDHFSSINLETFEARSIGQVERPNGFGFVPAIGNQ